MNNRCEMSEKQTHLWSHHRDLLMTDEGSRFKIAQILWLWVMDTSTTYHTILIRWVDPVPDDSSALDFVGSNKWSTAACVADLFVVFILHQTMTIKMKNHFCPHFGLNLQMEWEKLCDCICSWSGRLLLQLWFMMIILKEIITKEIKYESNNKGREVDVGIAFYTVRFEKESNRSKIKTKSELYLH